MGLELHKFRVQHQNTDMYESPFSLEEVSRQCMNV